MSKLSIQKARKEYICSSCGNKINIGEEYYRIVKNFSKDQIRCNRCKPSRSDLTDSDYLKWLYDLQDNTDWYACDVEDIKYSIEEMKDELESRLDNMPEGLRDCSDSGQLLQDRIDSLQEAYDILDNIDVSELDETYEDFVENSDFEEETEEEKRDKYDEHMEELIESVAGSIQEALDSILE